MSLVLRSLLAFVLVFGTSLAWADSMEEAPPEPEPAEEPAPEPPPPPPPPPPPEPEAAAPPEEEPEDRWYAGGGIALFEHDIGDDSGTITALNLRLGYYLLEWLALEGQANIGLSEADLDRALDTEVDLKRSLGIYLKPHFNFGPLDLFGTIGYADNEIEVSGPPGSIDVGDSGLSYGFGTRIPTSAGAFDLEYLVLQDEDAVAVEGLMFTYNRYF